MRNLLKYLLLPSTLLALSRPGATAEPLTAGITILATFDYPGATNTATHGINKRDEIAGSYFDSSLVSRGFTRMRDGTLSAPIVDPRASYSTTATGINHAQTVAGSFVDEMSVSHGFFLTDGSYTQYDFPGLDYTQIFGLNNAGDFCGAATDSTTYITWAFITIAGVGSIIDLPVDTDTAEAYGLNDRGEVVGYYIDPYTLTFHGFLRHSDGSVTASVDYPGASFTVPRGINNRGLIVGYYSNDATSGSYVQKLPDTFISYNYPDAIYTVFSGINDKNRIAGYYEDRSGGVHGFIAQFH